MKLLRIHMAEIIFFSLIRNIINGKTIIIHINTHILHDYIPYSRFLLLLLNTCLKPLLLLIAAAADDVMRCDGHSTYTPFNCLRSQLTHTQFSPHTIITKCNTLFSGIVGENQLSQALVCIFHCCSPNEISRGDRGSCVPSIDAY